MTKKSVRRVLIVAASLAVIAAAGCSWNSDLYDGFVGKSNIIEPCRNSAGVLDRIVFNSGTTSENDEAEAVDSEVICKHDDDCGGKTMPWEHFNTIRKNAFEHRICPKDYVCFDANGVRVNRVVQEEGSDKVSITAPDQWPDEVYCGLPNAGQVIEVIKCPSNTETCYDNDGNTVCIDSTSNTTCGATCADLQGVKCTGTTECRKGACLCEEGKLTCQDADGFVCIDPSDSATCGAVSCSERGMVCPQNSVCVVSQDSNYECVCGNGLITLHRGTETECINPSDDKTCGATDENPDGENCSAKADGVYQCKIGDDHAYSCVLTGCDENSNYCFENGEYRCVLKSDEQNCGYCNNNCGKVSALNAIPAGCALNTDTGNYQCSFRCNDSQSNCGSPFSPECVDLKSDNDNCLTCGTKCGGDQFCDNQKGCIPFSDVENECKSQNLCDLGNGKCVKDTNDLYNGFCGANCLDCELNHMTCVAGACVKDTCDAGYHKVYNSAGTMRGCELNTTSSCAAANNASNNEIINCMEKYPGMTEYQCNDGMCSFNCPMGMHAHEGSCEPDDISNCGEHGRACVYENAEALCINADCKMGACAPGYHLFDSACEADTAEHCGNHETVCSVEHGISACDIVNGVPVCKVASCDSGYHLFGAGCEVDSLLNCGSHGVACVTEHGVSSCKNGQCGIESCDNDYELAEDGLACILPKKDLCGNNAECANNDGSACITYYDIKGDQYKDCSVNGNCKSGFYLLDGACRTITPNECGKDGKCHGNEKKSDCINYDTYPYCNSCEWQEGHSCASVVDGSMVYGKCVNGVCTAQ